MADPWFESFFEHDPRPAIVAPRCSVIALYGELDTQVPGGRQLDRQCPRPFTDSSVPGHTIATIFSANHLFQEAVTGSVNEYARLKREFARLRRDPHGVAHRTPRAADDLGVSAQAIVGDGTADGEDGDRLVEAGRFPGRPQLLR